MNKMILKGVKMVRPSTFNVVYILMGMVGSMELQQSNALVTRVAHWFNYEFNI